MYNYFYPWLYVVLCKNSHCVNCPEGLALQGFSFSAGNEAVNTRLHRNKRSKKNNNVADLARKTGTAVGHTRDSSHQLVRCVCIFITGLGACSTGSAPLEEQLSLESCVAVNATSGAASLFQNSCIDYQGMYNNYIAWLLSPQIVFASFSSAQLIIIIIIIGTHTIWCKKRERIVKEGK